MPVNMTTLHLLKATVACVRSEESIKLQRSVPSLVLVTRTSYGNSCATFPNGELHRHCYKQAFTQSSNSIQTVVHAYPQLSKCQGI